LRIICTFGFPNTSHLAIVFGNFNLWASHSFQFWSFDDSLLHIMEFTLQGEFSPLNFASFYFHVFLHSWFFCFIVLLNNFQFASFKLPCI
jgi:hypothetical protein